MWFVLGRNESVVFYLAIFIFASLFAYLADRYGKRKKNGKKTLNKYFWIISFLIAWLPIALRYYVGTDYKNYMIIYSNISDRVFSVSVGIEPGFWLLNKIGQQLNMNFQYVISISSLITFVLFYIGLASYRKNVNVGIATFILLTSYYPFICNGVRQSIAMAFVFISYIYISERKLFKFLTIIFLGALFHYTIICIIPFYFICGKKVFPNWLKSLLMAVSILIMLNIEYYYPLFLSSSILFEKYSSYNAQEIKFGFGLLIYLVIYLFFYFVLYRNNKSDFNAMLIDILLVGFVLGYIGTAVPYGGRLVFYFSMSYILLVPQIIKVINKKLCIIYMLIIFSTFGFIWYNSAVINLTNETIPYSATFKLF